jgi:hypothetical protein
LAQVNHTSGSAKINPSEERAVAQLDQMQQLMQQLSMLLAQNQGTKASGMSLNSISSLNTQRVLDSGATDHMTGNKTYLKILMNFQQSNM